jgi:hypothetical protein
MSKPDEFDALDCDDETRDRVRRLFSPADPQFARWELIALTVFVPLAGWFVSTLPTPSDPGMVATSLFTSFVALFMLGMLKGTVIVTWWIVAAVRWIIAW